MRERILQLNDGIFGTHAEKKIFYTLCASLVFVVVLYAYLIGSIIFSAVVRKDIELTARDLQEKIGIMEIKYLNLTSKITPELAWSLGFKEATSQIFIPRTTTAGALSLRVNEN